MNEDKATRYQRLRRQASVLATGLSVLLLPALVVSGGSAWLRDQVDAVAGTSGPGALLGTILFVTVLVLVHEIVLLPLAWHRDVRLERRYGLSSQTAGRWWGDQGKGLLLSLVLLVPVAGLLRLLLAWSPDGWWLPAAVILTLLVAGLAQAAPVLLLPLFDECVPLARPDLVARLQRLAARAGAPVAEVFEWRLSGRTRKANAALAGLGRTRRILLSDTLLADHSDDEIEVILAHELAHQVHHDVWKGVAFQGLLLVLGTWLADRVLTAAVGSFGITAKGDLAALPLLAIAMGAVALLLVPVANAWSRAHERRADRFALELTANAGAFITAMRRLAAQNLAEDQPSRLVELLFYSHPPVSARIAAAQDWARRAPAGPRPAGRPA